MSLNKNIFGKILKWACIVLISLTCLFSTLIVSLGLISSCSSSNIAKADSVDEFFVYRGANQFLPTNNYYYNNGYQVNTSQQNYFLSCDFIIKRLALRDLGFSGVSGVDYLPILCVSSAFNRSYSPMTYYYDIIQDDKILPFEVDILNGEEFNYYRLSRVKLQYDDSSNVFGTVRSALNYGAFPNLSGFSGAYSIIRWSCDIRFNCDVIKVVYDSAVVDVDVLDYPNSGGSKVISLISNNITLFDRNGNTFLIEFFCSALPQYTPESFLMWETRTYYLTNTFSDNANYQNGLSDGKWIGASSDYMAGYDDGKKAGLTEGEDIGFNKGWQESQKNEFSFGWFLQNTLDILDVKIFGVFSLGDMFKVVLGVSLVIIVLKLFAGG